MPQQFELFVNGSSQLREMQDGLECRLRSVPERGLAPGPACSDALRKMHYMINNIESQHMTLRVRIKEAIGDFVRSGARTSS